MSTSDENVWGRQILPQMLAAVATAFFGAVYELFSHGVFSVFMAGAFALPLLLGFLPYAVLAWKDERRLDPAGAWYWNAGIAVLTVGSLLRGALEIYGTSNRLAAAYLPAGLALLAFGAFLALRRRRGRHSRS